MPGIVVVADMEAGLEHLSWAGGTLRHVDLLLVVVQATAKSLLTAHRTHALALQLGIPEVAFVGNGVGDGDRALLDRFAEDHGCGLLGVIPHDDAVRRVDQQGTCLLDAAPESPSVAAITALADALDQRIATPAH